GRRLLLERVQNIDRLFETDGVHGSKCVSLVRFDDFQHTKTEALPRLRRRRSSAKLRDAEGVPHIIAPAPMIPIFIYQSTQSGRSEDDDAAAAQAAGLHGAMGVGGALGRVLAGDAQRDSA